VGGLGITPHLLSQAGQERTALGPLVGKGGRGTRRRVRVSWIDNHFDPDSHYLHCIRAMNKETPEGLPLP